MATKILSVLTLLIALGATFLNFQSKALVEKLQTSADTEHSSRLKTEDELKKTKTKLDETEKKLASTEEELTGTKAKLRETEDNLTKVNADLTATKGMLAEKEKTLADLQEQMKKIAGEGGNADDLKKKIADIEAQTKDLQTKVTTLEKEKAELSTTLETLTVRLKGAEDTAAKQVGIIKKYKDGVMINGTRGTVTAVNSGWGFCVLSIGDKQGAAANRILIVTRDGQAIGKVKITSVESSQSVADIIPGSFAKNTYVEPGDRVIYTGEDKVRVEEPEAPPAAGNPPPPPPAAPGGLALPVQ